MKVTADQYMSLPITDARHVAKEINAYRNALDAMQRGYKRKTILYKQQGEKRLKQIEL